MSYENQIIYNNDNTVSIPFGRAAEWYIVNHPLLRNARLKSQSRLYVNTLIREGFIKLRRVEGATDYIEWETSGIRKSTNRVDDILELTEKGRSRVDNICIGIEKDKLCWYWVMYCADDGNRCQHLCGGIGTCKPNCVNYNLPNNLKNGNDMHRCSVRVYSYSRLSYLNTSHALRIKIEGVHLPSNVIMPQNTQITRINLTREKRDEITVSRRADHKTVRGIKGKLLAPYNNNGEDALRNAFSTGREVCNDKTLKHFINREDRRLKDRTGPWTILHYLIVEVLKPKGYVLYYQQPDLSKPEETADRYYQLTVSDEYWLKKGRDYGQYYLGIDGKYDLNIDRAPVLSIIVESKTKQAIPLAFGKTGRNRLIMQNN